MKNTTVPNDISIRDWFAGMALNGIISSIKNPCETNDTYKSVVKTAYEFADEMIKHSSDKEAQTKNNDSYYEDKHGCGEGDCEEW